MTLNAQDNNALAKIVSILSIFNSLCLMHAYKTITLNLTLKREFGIGQLVRGHGKIEYIICMVLQISELSIGFGDDIIVTS